MKTYLIYILLFSCFVSLIVVSIIELYITKKKIETNSSQQEPIEGSSQNKDVPNASPIKNQIIATLLWLQIRLTIVITVFVLIAMKVIDYINSIDVVNTIYKESYIHIDSESVLCAQQHYHLPIETIMGIILWLGVLVVLIIITLQIIKYILFFIEVILVESKILIATRINPNDRDIMNDIETLTNKLRYRNIVNINFRSLWNIYD